MNVTARGVARLLTVLVALLMTIATASVAMAADSTAVRSDVRAISTHAVYEAGASLRGLLPVGSVESEALDASDDEHWLVDYCVRSEVGNTDEDEHWFDDAVQPIARSD